MVDAWRALVSMHISTRVQFCWLVEAGAAQNLLGEKWRRSSVVSRFVRAGRRRCLRVAVAGRRDRCASPDRLRSSRFASFHVVCIASLSGKSQYGVSVCDVEIGGAEVVFVRHIHAKWPLRLRLENVFPFQRAYSRLLVPRFKNRRPWAHRRRDHLAKRL